MSQAHIISHPAAEQWNQRFATPHLYGLAPNEFFQAELDKLTPGSLLLPAEGQGRNAFYAASLGWEVTGTDVSATAKEQAISWLSEAGLAMNYVLAPHLELDFPAGSFDAIMMCYAHMSSADLTQFLPRLLHWLKPGGWFLLEGYHKAQLGMTSGGPKDLDWLYDEVELGTLLGSLSPLQVWRAQPVLSEGPLHTGLAEVVRVVGQKPLR